MCIALPKRKVALRGPSYNSTPSIPPQPPPLGLIGPELRLTLITSDTAEGEAGVVTESASVKFIPENGGDAGVRGDDWHTSIRTEADAVEGMALRAALESSRRHLY